MATHISIDPDNRIIDLITPPSGGVVQLEAIRDIYSEAKDEWLAQTALGLQLRRLRFPFRPLTAFVGGVQIGPFAFLSNDTGWRIRPYDADHELLLIGDLVSESDVYPSFLPQAGRTIPIRSVFSARTQTALGVAAPPWDATEKSQIRHVLGLDGTTAAPAQKAQLIVQLLNEDLATYTTDGTLGEQIQIAVLKAALAAALAASK